jgi:hypothetical protein
MGTKYGEEKNYSKAKKKEENDNVGERRGAKESEFGEEEIWKREDQRRQGRRKVGREEEEKEG